MTADVPHHVECLDSLSPMSMVAATPEQVLHGHSVEHEHAPTACIGCSSRLVVGDIVFAYASLRAGFDEWEITRLYCRRCTPSGITTPTLGATEILVGGRLGTVARPTTRRHQLCLTELAVRDESPPTQGAES